MVVQGINDVVLFTVSGAGSVVSGYMYGMLGWSSLLVLTILMVCNLRMFLSDDFTIPCNIFI